jgi:hypothetical protein
MLYAADEFYRLRDRRTKEYLGSKRLQDRHVHVKIDRVSAEQPAGQFLLLSLINQLSRVHRNITVEMPETTARVDITTPFPGATLSEVAIQTMSEIDPYGNFALDHSPVGDHVSIGIGAEVGDGLDIYLGADRSVAYLRRSPVLVTPFQSSMIGAALASCLGAAAVFRTQLGERPEPRALSAWNYKEGEEVDFGPEVLQHHDIGSVMMVGAGAVGASAAYWMYALGFSGKDWSVVDGDDVELHNTNRGLIFTAKHAGWPGLKPFKKVDVLAPLLVGATTFSAWYDQCDEIRNKKFDVILALANDRNVRQQLAHRNAIVSLQATTGENWLSQLHRHILGKDDCIWCRTGEIKEASFGCSTAVVEEKDGTKSDAALPFLSAASGLMLVTALMRLDKGAIAEGPYNCWSWDFGSDYKMAPRASVRSCSSSCKTLLPFQTRQKINANSRWAEFHLQ